ncbi:hypothetical protein QLX08_003868 [Tetragonisca angustula]|uniref:Uncharacterized protein n=1 Tax=Tetragonisca angustula TaxID=166442 RepID=A0AAW1A6S1_9HYME
MVLKSIPWTFHALTFNEESLTLFQRQVQTLRDDHPSYGLDDDSESTGADLPANRLENRLRKIANIFGDINLLVSWNGRP